MNKYMKELSALKPDDMKRKEKELREEIVMLKKSIRLGNTHNYRAATHKRRQLARLKSLLQTSQAAQSKEQDTKSPKEKK